MHRRMLLAFPLIAAMPAWAARFDVTAQFNVSEVRVGGAWPGEPARMLQARLGIPVRAVALSGSSLARALSEGHLEAAVVDRESLRQAQALMGSRLMVIADGPAALVTRAALPAQLRAAIADALLA